MQQEKEFTLNQALKYQNEIAVQESKIKELTVALNDLYAKYGYPGLDGDNGIAPSAAASSKTRNITFEDVRKLTVNLSKQGKTVAVKGLLLGYGCSSIRDLREDEIVEFYNELKTLL